MPEQQFRLLFLLFAAPGDLLLYGYLSVEIIYDRNGFTVRGPLRSRRYSYGDVTGIRLRGDVTLYIGRRHILMDAMCSSREDFLGALDRWQRRHGVVLPEQTARDPFLGHVDNPWFISFMLALELLICTVILPAACVWVAVAPLPDLTERTVVFTAAEADGDTLLLHAGDETFRIEEYADYGIAADQLKARCDGTEQFTVQVQGEKNWVYALTGESGTQYLTLEGCRTVYRRSQLPAVPFLLLFSAGGIWMSVMAFRVGRHPERYSERVRGLFFRKDALH